MLPEASVKYYTAAVALALGHLHRQRFIYRDLKPENLLLDAHGHLKLCDLGLAKRTDRAYTLVGTPQYIAPEVLRAEGATGAADWWALGILVFEMLNGELPFNSLDGSDRTLFTAIKLGVFVWPREPRFHRKHSHGAVPSACVRDLVASLLAQNVPPPPTKAFLERARGCAEPMRLGSGPTDVEEVLSHPWFQGFDFDALLNGEYPPPFVPKLMGPEDDSNFGPIDWRGEPVVHDPSFDREKWDSAWTTFSRSR